VSEPAQSGLRNPGAAARGVGAGALVAEAIVLLLAIQPVLVLNDDLPSPAIWAIVGMAVACVALAGLLRHAWAWPAAAGLQVVLFASGFVLHASLTALGVIFGLLWAYVLHVRRRVLAPPVR
jgi:hypothetical protein